jgi:hypothetical protein
LFFVFFLSIKLKELLAMSSNDDIPKGVVSIEELINFRYDTQPMVMSAPKSEAKEEAKDDNDEKVNRKKKVPKKTSALTEYERMLATIDAMERRNDLTVTQASTLRARVEQDRSLRFYCAIKSYDADRDYGELLDTLHLVCTMEPLDSSLLPDVAARLYRHPPEDEDDEEDEDEGDDESDSVGESESNVASSSSGNASSKKKVIALNWTQSMWDGIRVRLILNVRQRALLQADAGASIEALRRRLRRSSVRRQLCFESVLRMRNVADEQHGGGSSDDDVSIRLVCGVDDSTVLYASRLSSSDLADHKKSFDGELSRINRVLAVRYPWAAVRWHRYRWAIESAKHEAHARHVATAHSGDDARRVQILRQVDGFVQSTHESAQCPMVLFGDGAHEALAHWATAQGNASDARIVLVHDVNATLSSDCHIDIVRRVGYALKDSWLPELDVFEEHGGGEDDEADATMLLERWLALLPSHVCFVLVLLGIGAHSYTLASLDGGSASSASSSSMLRHSAPFSSHEVPPTRCSERPSARALLEWLPRHFAFARLRVVAVVSSPDADARSLAAERGWPNFVVAGDAAMAACDKEALDRFERDATTAVCGSDARLTRDVYGMIALSRHGLSLHVLQSALVGRAGDATLLALLRRGVDAKLLDGALAACQLRYHASSATVGRRMRRRFAEHRHRAMLVDALERAQLIDTGAAQKLGELPFQLRDAAQWRRLERLLGNVGPLLRMTRHSAALRLELVDHLRALKRGQSVANAGDVAAAPPAPLSSALESSGGGGVAAGSQQRADLLVIVGRLASSTGNTGLAEQCFRDALSIVEPLRGPNDPHIVAQLYHWLAALTSDVGYAQRALDIVRSRLIGPFEHRFARMQRLRNRLAAAQQSSDSDELEDSLLLEYEEQ